MRSEFKHNTDKRHKYKYKPYAINFKRVIGSEYISNRGIAQIVRESRAIALEISITERRVVTQQLPRE